MTSQSDIFSRARRAAPILLILIVAALLRLYNVGFGLPALYDPDEPMFMMASVRMLRDHTLNPGWFGHPGTTTIYVLAAIEIITYGFGWLAGDYASPAAFSRATYADPAILFVPGRLFFVACGVFCIYLTYLLGKRLFDRRVGLLAASLLAVNPLHIMWSQVIRTDIQATIFILACMLFATRIVERGRTRDYLLAGIMAGLACATKWPAALVIITICAASAVRIVRDPTSLREQAWRLALSLLAGAVTLVAVSPFLLLDYPTVLENLAGEAQVRHVGATGTGFLGNAGWYLGTVLRECLGPVGLLLAAAGAILAVSRHRAAAALLVPFVLIFFAIVCIQNLIWTRWILPLLPVLSVFAAVAASALVETIRVRTGRATRLLAQAALALVMFVPIVQGVVAEARERRHDTRMQASAWARTHIPDGSRIALEHLAFDLLDRQWIFLIPAGRPGCVDAVKHLTGQIRYAKIEKWRKDKAIVDIGTVAPERLETCRGDYAILTHLDRYRAEAAHFGPELTSYNRLVAGGELLATFAPSPGAVGGPTVRIYRLARPLTNDRAHATNDAPTPAPAL